MEIVPFQSQYVDSAAALFVENLGRLRLRVPVLSDRMTDPQMVADKLRSLLDAGPAVIALDQGKLVGYLGSYLIDHFRDTERKAAFCPEWGYAVQGDRKEPITRALYRAAAEQWTEAGCHAHAISLLAHDPVTQNVWFWQGFGLLVVDAVRPLTLVDTPSPTGITIRQATADDVELLARLDAEHWQHYAQPPILMAVQWADDPAAWADFLTTPGNSAWLAIKDSEAAGFMRFERHSRGAAAIVAAETNVAITGAFVRPAYRGCRAAVALLNAAFADYARQGIDRCSVDFEAINPEAAAFWMKYFDPVCLSVMRVPEKSK
jgi:GNAT superfamily N-acetyltransferase